LALAKARGIQEYQEDSQFGLLKVTLTLAGNCFVVDIDLETDAAADEDEVGSSAPTPALAISGGNGATEPGSDSVRLSKIAVNYVTHGGGMEASEYVAGVLRSAVDAYLAVWNSAAHSLAEAGERGKALEKTIRRIDGLLGELKALDGSAPKDAADKGDEAGFAGLEAIAKRFEGLTRGPYVTSRPTV
jgi:hypothetical protein